MKSYGQFCPVAKAAEIFAERWTPLIVRELLSGSRRFNEIEHGVPGVPRSLLVERLRSLERAGVVERRSTGNRVDYFLTSAGEELFTVVKGLGEWGQRWLNRDIEKAELDPALLMWDMKRRIHLDRLPDRRIVVRIDFVGARRGRFWLILERPEPSVCFHDPGFDVDLVVTADALALHRVWMGREALSESMRRKRIRLEGPAELRRGFPSWLALNLFAGVGPAPRNAASGGREAT